MLIKKFLDKAVHLLVVGACEGRLDALAEIDSYEGPVIHSFLIEGEPILKSSSSP